MFTVNIASLNFEVKSAWMFKSFQRNYIKSLSVNALTINVVNKCEQMETYCKVLPNILLKGVTSLIVLAQT